MNIFWNLVLLVYVFIAGGVFMISSFVSAFSGERGFKVFVERVLFSALWPIIPLINTLRP